MRIESTLSIAFRALRRNKMRSVLTALGIIIGVAAVIAMVGIGNGAKAQVEAQIASLGQNVILIFSGSTTSSGIRTGWGGAGTLKIEDAEAIRREVPGVAAVSEEVVSTAQVAAGNQNWFTRIYGESADYLDIRQWPLADGVPFTAQDVRSANKVCVIGRTTASQVYGSDDPVGQILRIKNVPFTVTGILTPKGLSTQGVDQDDVVIMPFTSAMKRVVGGTTLRNINVQIGDGRQIAAAQQQIISLLRQRHNIRTGRDDDFTVRNQQEIADAATATTAVMTVLLGSIAGVSLALIQMRWGRTRSLLAIFVTFVCFAVNHQGHEDYQADRSPISERGRLARSGRNARGTRALRFMQRPGFRRSRALNAGRRCGRAPRSVSCCQPLFLVIPARAGTHPSA